MAREAITYRAARRNEARRRKLLWRHVVRFINGYRLTARNRHLRGTVTVAWNGRMPVPAMSTDGKYTGQT